MYRTDLVEEFHDWFKGLDVSSDFNRSLGACIGVQLSLGSELRVDLERLRMGSSTWFGDALRFLECYTREILDY